MEQTVEQCNGCGRVASDGTCRVYEFPAAKWRRGRCPMATHLARAALQAERKPEGWRQQKQKKKRRS